ncbi:hypothetical protein PSHT_01985 [Puccinia striiformis]|uniref:Uncharacterized protein n=1 Tax=Puccinia striiformis TaxID=27350 RepID=A0A2S4WJ69_9BASI|nr:hypothetical protein PSHT_01985 [Puccinia striiformis]
MPSHLRNGRDLSGKQRQRNVKAGLSNIAGQRTVQRAEGKPSFSQPGADERPRTEHRSNSDGIQLPSHFSSAKVRHVNASSVAGGLLNRVVDGEPTSNYRRGDHLSVEPSSSRQQKTTGDVHKHVPLPVVHVRRSQEGRRQSSHESCSESGDIEPGAYLSNSERRGDDGGVRKLASSSGNGHNVPGETSVQPFDYLGDSSLYHNSLPLNRTALTPGRCSNDLPGSYPSASTGSTSLIDLVSPPDHSQLGLCTGSKPSAEPHSTSRSIRDKRVELHEPERAANDSFEHCTKLCSELRAEHDERSSSEPRAERNERPSAKLRAELYDAVSAKPQPVYVRAPQTPSTPAGLKEPLDFYC